MSLDTALEEAIKTIPECLAAGYTDLESGMLLGMKTVDSYSDEFLETLAAATTEMFQGTNVILIEDMVKNSRGLPLDDKHYFKEFIVNSDNLVHVFIRGKINANQVATFVCSKSANLGLVLNKSRAAIVKLESEV